PQPREILENGRFELATASRPIVIFDPHQHAPAERARHAPHVGRIDDMPEMQVPRGRRGEPRYDAAHYAKGFSIVRGDSARCGGRRPDWADQTKTRRVDDLRRPSRQHSIFSTRSD